MAINTFPGFFARDIIPEYCDGFESSEVHSGPSFFVEFLPSSSNRSIPHLALSVHAKEIICIFIKSSSYIPLCHLRSLTWTQPRSYKMFEA
jgi:hypothetical protein